MGGTTLCRDKYRTPTGAESVAARPEHRQQLTTGVEHQWKIASINTEDSDYNLYTSAAYHMYIRVIVNYSNY